MDLQYLDINKFTLPSKIKDGILIKIEPFEYLDGKPPRLPRKHSKKYKLFEHTCYYFEYILKEVNFFYIKGKYSVSINVVNGNDRLGAADLDNYCKPILDAITKTKKIWFDDKQVDFIKIERSYSNDKSSSLEVSIVQL